MKIAACFLVLASLASGQVAIDANKGYQTPEQRGNVAANLVRADRDETQKPQELVQAMGVKPGMVVADIGTGAGYMLPFLSESVGPRGKVLAEDIFDDFLSKAKDRAREKGLSNVEFVKGTVKNVGLPPGAVDIALALDSYHHYDHPAEMVSSIRDSLKPGGRFVIVDYYKRPGAMSRGDAMQHIRLDEDDVVREVEAQGFHEVSRHEHIPGSQYMVIFQK